MPVQQTASLLFTFTVESPVTLTVQNFPPPPYLIGQVISAQLVAAGGVGPYTYFVKPGDVLPSGLTLSPTGALGGVLVAGIFNFTLQARDTGV